MSQEIPELARRLDLARHPEGGWYRQTWRTATTVSPEGYGGRRPTATGIYYLLSPGEESVWHQVRSDELWLHHLGAPLSLRIAGHGSEPADQWHEVVLSPALEQGHTLQALVPAGHWQSAHPIGDDQVLVSCIVSPGFDFADFRIR